MKNLFLRFGAASVSFLVLLPPGARAAQPVYANAVLADHPVLYYGFDETSGAVAADSSGGGKDGTYFGNVGFEFESFHPNLGTAIALDGTSAFIDVPALGTLPQSSIEVWINIDGVAAGCCTSIYSTDGFGAGNLHFNIKSGRDVEHAISGGNPNNNNTPGNVIQNGIWYHVVVTYDTRAGGETKFYVDGVEVATSAHASKLAALLNDAQVGAWNGGRLLDARIDEFAIFDRILSPERVQAHFDAGSAAMPDALPLRVEASGPDLVFTWKSKAGMRYKLRSETGLSTDPVTWPVFDGNQDIAAAPPENTLAVPLPADARRFFIIEEFPAPPVTLFAESFDGVTAPALPGGWSTGRNDPPDDGASTTNWEVGTPSTVGPVPPGTPLPSGTQCVATGIASDYDDPATDSGNPHTDIWLRTTAIDLTGHLEGTLTFQQWTEIEDVTGDLDYGSIRILDAFDDSALAVLDDRAIDGTTNGWEAYSRKLPAEAFTATNGTIRIEFRFEADDLFSFAGWYIDDVAVTVPAASGNPYDTWALEHGLTAANNAPGGDPDKDGETNLYEFAFDGDPLAISDKGKVFGLTGDSDFDGDSDPELLLTVAVRTGAPAFSGSPSPTAAHDGIIYTVEGSTILSSFPTPVNVVPTPLTTGLPATRSGYEYRSFSLAGSNGLPLIGFLRAQATQP